jgi:hypothetical protein
LLPRALGRLAPLALGLYFLVSLHFELGDGFRFIDKKLTDEGVTAVAQFVLVVQQLS